MFKNVEGKLQNDIFIWYRSNFDCIDHKKVGFLTKAWPAKKSYETGAILSQQKEAAVREANFLSPELVRVLNIVFSPHSEMLMDDTCKAKQKSLGKE